MAKHDNNQSTYPKCPHADTAPEVFFVPIGRDFFVMCGECRDQSNPELLQSQIRQNLQAIAKGLLQ